MTQSTWKGGATTASPPDGPFEHSVNGTPWELPALPQADYAAHAPVGTVKLSATDMANFMEQNLPAVPGTAPRILSPDELAHAQQRIAGSDVDGVARCGWGYTQYPKQLWHTGAFGDYYVAGMRIYPDLGYAVCASTTMGKDQCVGAMLDYMEKMEKNWTGLFGS
jgi:hypothetical protein